MNDSLEAKLNYFLTDWLKLAREIRAESSNTFQKPYAAGCTASHYYLPVQFTQAKHGRFSLWLLHYQYFLQRQYSANQYKYLAYFLNSGSFLLHARCSISDSHTDENIPTWQMSKKVDEKIKPSGSQICHKHIQDISN